MKGKINIFLFWVFLFPALVEAKIPNAEDVFQNLLDAENTVSFVGKRLIVDWQFPPRSITMEELIIKKAPDKVIMEILSPWELRGKKIIRNAERTWFENFEKDEFLPPPPPPEFSGRKTFFQDIPLLKRNYNVTISTGGNPRVRGQGGYREPEALSDESNIIAGRKTYQIEITPKHPGRPAKKLWLDAQRNIVLRMEDYSSDGRLMSLLVYTEIDFQPQIDEKLFAISPSGRNHRIRELKEETLSLSDAQKRSHFPVKVPQNLPEGFAFKGAHIKKIDGIQHVHLRYADGLTTLSLFESKADGVSLGDRPPKGEHHRVEEIFIGKVKCKITSPPGRVRILHWTTKPVPEHDVGLSFTLIGEISKSEMIAIAESLILS
ncbi:MAG: sigma-E factor regulatory protein RseB domain-containing protein [Candidatus Poribacteria bacterium]